MTYLRFLIPLACSGILAAPALAQDGAVPPPNSAQTQIGQREAPISDSFGVVVPALRAAANVVTDPGSRPSTVPRLNVWLQQYGWGTSHSIGEAANHGIRGWGAMGGVELAAGRRDYVGVSAGFFRSDASTGPGPVRDKVRLLEGAVHWRRDWGSLASVIRLAAGTLTSSSNDAGSGDAERKRKDVLLSATGTLQRDYPIGRRLRITPALAADYYRLAGGNAAGRAQSAVTGTVGLGYELGSMAEDAAWLRMDLQGGARAIVSDHFGAGDNAAIAQRGGGLLRLRLSGGREAFSLTGEASAEQQREGTGIALRLGSRLSW